MSEKQARGVYTHDELVRMFDPKSVAIVGASANPASFGARTLASLSKFSGSIFLVNGKYEELEGRRCYKSLCAIGEVPDCVVAAIPREAVEDLVRESVQLGVGGLVIFASGFGESGDPQWEAAQRRIVELTRNSKTRLLGPNCLGVVNGLTGFHAVFANAPTKPIHPGGRKIGLISQSGALGMGLAQACERGVSFSHVFTLGNACDVDVADQISYLSGDPGCDVIACVFEGTEAPQRLLEAGRLAKDAKKPVVIFKLATGESGAEAAKSHTGALAGSSAAYDAFFERAGFVTVSEFEELLETAAFFAKAPRPKAAGVAVLTPSGGAGILAADQAELHGVPMPQPGPDLQQLLAKHIPSFGAARNPCDVTAQILNNPVSFPACAEGFLSQPDIGAIAVPNGYAHEAGSQRIIAIGPLARDVGKIVCAYWLTGWLEGPGAFDLETDPNVALFRTTARCFRTLASWHKWWAGLDLAIEHGSRLTATGVADSVADMLDRAQGVRTLAESQSKEVLSAYGVPVVSERLVQSAEAALTVARGIGFPVVIKVESPDLPHKTEAGVVRLNIRDEEELAAAYIEVMGNAAKVEPPPRINGVLVQPMVTAGVEIMVGGRVDPLFGPLIVVGMGGVMVELLRDTVVQQAPVYAAGAARMLRRLQGYRLLQGFRGAAAVDEAALCKVIQRVSEMIADQRSRVEEVDVNPLICSAERILAVDALVVKAARQDVASVSQH
ncbi:ATP-grasp domain protein [Xylophilus ampelinus]|nr:acetate--CoA ligase family protein [Variovorax sp.]VTY30513.1 ATP-grasp domain protein [Xylophilus ampelinus]